MNADELKAALQPFYDNYDEIGVAVYAIIKGQEDIAPKKIDIAGDALPGLKRLFIESLRESITEREQLTVLDLSTADERIDALYVYDIDLPSELLSIEAVLGADDLPLLDLGEVPLSEIKAILVEIGNDIGQLVLYKTMASVNIFGRNSFFLRKDRHRMERIDEEFLRISSGFQLLRINGELLVMDLGAIERSFGFHEVITKEAAAGVAAIEALGLLENPEVLLELIGEVKYARRFTKVAKSSPVIAAEIPNNTIIDFCKSFPALAGKIRFNEAEDKVLLDTQVSKDLFIKLLMDNFLTSELTQRHYESVAKDLADADVE